MFHYLTINDVSGGSNHNMMTLDDSQSRVGVTLDDVMALGFPSTNSHSFPRKHNNVVNRKGRGFY